MSTVDGNLTLRLGGTSAIDGLPLRDWFAGQAAAAIVGGLAAAQVSTPEESASLVAVASYRLADAMLKERVQ